MSLKIIKQTIICNFKKEFTYKIDFFCDIACNILFYSFQLIIFSTVFSYVNKVEEWSYQSFYLGFLFYIFIYFSIEAFTSSISNFFELLFEGKIAPLLCAPVSLLYLIFFRFFSPNKIIVSSLFFMYLLYYLFSNNIINIFNELFLLFLVLFVIILINLIYIFILNFLVLLSERQIPVEYIHGELFGLSLIPPTIYSSKIFYSLLAGFPIILSSSIPVFIFEHKKFYYLYYLFPIAIIFVLLTIIMLKKIKHYYGVFGG
ncbi:ABC-2 family transporter protein [Spirobacillus cienkowskii]|jgi:ABC-type uncharacterized transport system permease subunit|uniref:Uncharacterized protein n=1 Tax=Spirobacillus cienkowskii TaxID=495820 RepID=A0A369KUG2_9BACT|nr:MAG: hypothetical protein DCC88_10320 [Spirobacillus cienkowskii]